MEIRAEAALFPEKEYINGIAVAVYENHYLISRRFSNLLEVNTVHLKIGECIMSGIPLVYLGRKSSKSMEPVV